MADNDSDQPHGGNSTPLLFLLDGVLSQDDDRVTEAVIEIKRLVPKLSVDTTIAPCTSSALCHIVTALLEHYPEFAGMRSEHDGSLPLHFAASLGNVQVAQAILEKFPLAASSPNDKGKIPLHYAAREGRSLEMVHYFLRASPETCAMATSKGKLAVHFAAGDGHTAITSALLKHYPQSAALPSSKGKLPLHFCARWGYLEIAYDLIQVYPDSVRALDWEGSLPLHDAAREGQYRMSRYLIERFPTALQTANLRGEIPLFPAVRSANVELVLLMIQAWPMGGKHILRNVSADDNVSSWNADILELLLRGSVDNLRGCPLLVGHEPPTVRLTDDLQPEQLLTMAKSSTALKKIKKSKVTTVVTVPALGGSFASHPYQPRLVAEVTSPVVALLQAHHGTVSPYATSVAAPIKTTSTTTPLVRSKSPILNDMASAGQGSIPMSPGKKKHSRKRPRHGVHVPSDEGLCRTFIPLHAAFECQAACHVIERVLHEHPQDVLKTDERGRLALHWAVTHCHDQNDIVELVLNETKDDSVPSLPPFITTSSASTRDGSGKLPLHLAIESRADVRIISALLAAFPAAGVEPCRCMGDNMTPIEMATQYGCDLSTVFVLLRVDPSRVHGSIPDAVTATL